MRELGRRSGRARRKPNPERVHESLRTYLRREVPPERVWQALEAAMLGNSESARVAASRVLMDALHEPERDSEVDRAKAGAEAREALARELAKRARHHEHEQVRDALDELAAELERRAVDEHPDLVVGDVRSERAAAVLALMEERGLIVGPERVEELAEEKAQERLLALRQEHGV